MCYLVPRKHSEKLDSLSAINCTASSTSCGRCAFSSRGKLHSLDFATCFSGSLIAVTRPRVLLPWNIDPAWLSRRSLFAELGISNSALFCATCGQPWKDPPVRTPPVTKTIPRNLHSRYSAYWASPVLQRCFISLHGVAARPAARGKQQHAVILVSSGAGGFLFLFLKNIEETKIPALPACRDGALTRKATLSEYLSALFVGLI